MDRAACTYCVRRFVEEEREGAMTNLKGRKNAGKWPRRGGMI